MIDEDLLFCIPSLVSEDDNRLLLTLPSMEELKEVVFSMDVGSAPGLDGFSDNFFQTCWDICNAMIFFLEGGTIPRGVNATVLALIPKVQNPSSFSEFRPISLCNFLYNIFSKLITKRLAVVLPNILSEQQHAFVKG